MVIALLWLGVVCCGVANGLVYDYVRIPESYCFMASIGTINIVLLIFHRFYTQDWCKSKKKGKKNTRFQYHYQIFGFSAMLSIGAFASSLLSAQAGETSWGFFIGSFEVMVSFFIATARESYYI